MELNNLACVGLVSFDEIVIDNNSYDCFGGSVVYSALQFSKFKIKSYVLSVSGSDLYNDFKELLLKYGIEDFHIEIIGEKTLRFQNIYVGDNRRQKVINYRPIKINLSILLDKRFDVISFLPILNELDFKQIEGLRNKAKMFTLDIQGLCRQVRNGMIIKKSLEREEESYLGYFDIVKADYSELIAVSDSTNLEESLNKIAELGCKIILITLGKIGSLAYSKNGLIYMKPFRPSKIIDTTGAGDVFLASFVYYFLKTSDIKSSLTFASAAASYKVENMCFKSIESEEKILQRIKEQNIYPIELNFYEFEKIIRNVNL